MRDIHVVREPAVLSYGYEYAVARLDTTDVDWFSRQKLQLQDRLNLFSEANLEEYAARTVRLMESGGVKYVIAATYSQDGLIDELIAYHAQFRTSGQILPNSTPWPLRRYLGDYAEGSVSSIMPIPDDIPMRRVEREAVSPS